MYSVQSPLHLVMFLSPLKLFQRCTFYTAACSGVAMVLSVHIRQLSPACSFTQQLYLLNPNPTCTLNLAKCACVLNGTTPGGSFSPIRIWYDKFQMPDPSFPRHRGVGDESGHHIRWSVRPTEMGGFCQ